MLTEQCVIIEAPSADTGPIRFVTTDDGRAVVAVTEHDNGILEIMASPMTLLQQNDSVPHSFIKAVDGNIILHPAIFQINVENLIGNGIHQTALLPVQTLGTGPIVFEQAETLQEKEYNTECENYVTDAALSDTEVTQKEKEQKYQEDVVDTVHTDKHVHKRNPGRPRKSGANIRALHNMKCDICGQEFNKQVQFRRHMEQHAEEKPHRCPKCPASFNIPINFTLHMATHNAGEPKCPECGRKFARMASLKSHMLIHEKEENLFCTECEDAFSTRAQLDAHLKLHGEKWNSEDVRKCKLCNRQFVQPALYRLHIREHYRLQTKIVKQTKRGTKHKTMYKCTICLKSFQKPSQLMRHIRVHTGEKPFKCSTCNRGFTQKGSLQIHMWQHNGIRPHTCNLCNAKFSQKGNLNAHILRVHNAPEGEPIYGCTHCSCVFKKLGSLNGHMKRTHSNPVEESSVPAKCDSSTEADIRATVNNVISQLVSLESTTNDVADSTNSGTTPTKKSDILQEALKNSGLPSKHKTTDNDHTKKETDARTAYVTLLDRAPDGSMRKYLAIKQRCIGNVRWYSCSFCHKEFKKPSDLIRHLRVHTQEKPFKCSRCFRSFALKSTMIAHERTHTGTKKYACDSCDKTFTCHSGLTVHARLHATPYKCNVCDKSFSASAILKNHMKSHSKGKPKLSPEAEVLVPQIVLQEPLVISDADNKISLARVQSKQGQLYNNQDVARPHKCFVCPAAFRKISHLKQHYRRHTGERPYKCSKCDRRFTSNSVLKSHLHTHEDTRPYSCSVCNTKFSTQSSMKRHLVTHSNKRPFMCPYCHKTFKTSVNCRKHMKIHKHELAQRQLEQQKSEGNNSNKTYEEQKEVMPTLTENLELSEDIEVSFQPQMAPDFTQAFSDQFQSITEEKEKSFLSTTNTTQLVVSHSLPEVDTSNIASSQTLHADETGTITLPNYSGDQTLTPESIREIEETLNQQLFNMGVNLSLNGNLSRQIDDTNTTSLETREQPVLNIIYENNKHLESSGNTIFTSHFDSFDMSQIALQPDTDIDIGLNSTNAASMSNIFPKAIQDVQQQQLVSVPNVNRITEDQIKSDTRLMVVSSDENCTEIPSLVQVCQKYPKIIAKADTTDRTETRSSNDESNKQQNSTESCENDVNTVSFACDLCNEVFQNLTQMETHAKLHSMASITCSDNAGRTVCVTQSESLLQCHMCNERGFTTVELKEHLKTHCGTKEYQCTECPLRFCTNGGLSRHLKMHLSKNNRMQLRLQNKTPENSWNVTSMEPDSSQRDLISLEPNIQYNNTLDTKIRSDSSVSEKVLLDTVAEKEIIDRLEDVSVKKEQKEYTNKCKYCPKTFRKPSDLIRHVRTHTGERPYKCDFCSKSFAVKCTLDSHMKVHTGKKTFCCHVCSSLFATKGSLKVHMRLHTGSKPFRCQICDLRFRTSGHRKVHLMKHARDHKSSPNKRKQKHLKVAAIAEVAASLEKSVQSVPQPVIINNEAEQNIEYPTVDQIGLDATALTNPITFNSDGAILNNNSMLSINEGHQFYAVTNLNFLLDNGLMTIQADDTLTVQPQNSQTNINHDTTKVNELVTANSLTIPSNEENSNQVVITSQLQDNPTSHTPIRALPITTTDQTSIQLNNCMSLIQIGQTNSGSDKAGRTVSKTGGKGGNQSKKECDICGKTFVKPCQVERHKRIHTGERPYKCDLCTKSFAQKSTLQIHQKHHTGDRPHSCPYCEFSFSQKCNLETHLKRVHQLDVVEVKKLRRGQVLSSKLLHDNLSETKILNVDDISFVELLK